MNKQELYNLVFEDGEQYTRFYFEQRRNKAHSLTTIIDGQVVALASYVDLAISDGKNNYKTALISGVCTHPDMRGKGVMQILLDNLLEQLQTLQYDIALLSPVKDNYYKKYGFESLIKGDLKQIIYQNRSNYTLQNASKIDTKTIFDLYGKHCKNTTYSQVLTQDIVLDLIDEFSMGNSAIWLVLQNNNTIGWIATSDKNIEIAVLNDLNILSNLKQLENYTYYLPNVNGQKDLFQIKYLKNSIKKINLNDITLLNKY